MHIEIAFIIKVFAALFAIMNPLANIPVFLSLTEGTSDAERMKIATRALIGVAIGCVVSAVAGGWILRAFGLTVDDFRLAGGIIVLLIALSMLHGSSSNQHAPTGKEQQDIADIDSVAVYPLTIPLLVGPGTIATMIIFGQTALAKSTELSLAIGTLGFIGVLAVALLSAPFIGHYFTPTISAITKRLMGMILAAIATQMIVSSLQTFFLVTAAAH